jgi:hypothetical protein
MFTYCIFRMAGISPISRACPLYFLLLTIRFITIINILRKKPFSRGAYIEGYMVSLPSLSRS